MNCGFGSGELSVILVCFGQGDLSVIGKCMCYIGRVYMNFGFGSGELSVVLVCFGSGELSVVLVCFGQGGLSIIGRCTCYRGRFCMNFGLFWTRSTVRISEVKFKGAVSPRLSSTSKSNESVCGYGRVRNKWSKT